MPRSSGTWGPGNGFVRNPGWGGPAKGEGSSKAKNEPFNSETGAAAVKLAHTAEAWADRQFKAEVTAKLNNIRLTIAEDDALAEQVRLTAIDSLDRAINGMPKARIEHSGGIAATPEARKALAANARARYGSGTD